MSIIFTQFAIHVLAGCCLLWGAETIQPEDERFVARIGQALLAPGAPEVWPVDLPPLSDLITSSSGYRRGMSFYYIYEAIKRTNSPEDRRKLCYFLCKALKDPDKADSQNAVKNLSTLVAEDFSPDSINLINAHFSVRFYDEEILLAGVFWPESYGEKIREIASRIGPVFHPEYNAKLAAALIVLARWGNEEAFDRLIADLSKLPSENLYIGHIQKLEYILNGIGIGYFISLLGSTDKLDFSANVWTPQGDGRDPSVAKFAALSLSRMLSSFPIKAPPAYAPFALYTDGELDECRAWVSRQKDFRNINGVAIPVGAVTSYPRSEK